MKKRFATLILLFIFSFTILAQEFEGNITYSISYADLPEEMQAYESMLPKEMNFLVKNDKSKMTQAAAMGGETVVITDQSNKKTTVLVNTMGFKVAVSKNLAEEQSEPEIKYVDENKTIAGYPCKKAILTDENGIKTTLWYTEEIPALGVNLGLKGIKGLPMEFETTQNGINAKIVATSISEEKVDDSEFEIPEGYKEMSEEEFQKMMQSQGGGM